MKRLKENFFHRRDDSSGEPCVLILKTGTYDFYTRNKQMIQPGNPLTIPCRLFPSIAIPDIAWFDVPWNIIE